MKTYLSLLLSLCSILGLQAQVIADFESIIPDPNCPPVLVSFVNTSVGENLEYYWDFGDGTISSEVNPVHNYFQGGIFQVCLTATNTVSQESDLVCKNVQVEIMYGDTTSVFYDLCPGEFVTIGGQIFDENNPNGEVVFQDINGCDSVVFFSLNFFPEIFEYYELNICDGESITVNGTLYDVSNPSGTEIFESGAVNGCDSIVEINLLLGLQIDGILTGDLSPGNTVLLEVIMANGTGPYTYNWTDSPGNELGTDPTLTVTEPGEYTVIVLDNIGCPGDYTFTVVESSELQIEIVSANDVICEGQTDGLIVVDVFNGLAPYSFVWDNGITGNIIANLEPGIYCVTATDAMGNEGDRCFAIEASGLNVEAELSQVACQNDGFIDLTLSGFPPYSFSWSNNEVTEDIDNLAPGSYNVTINDFYGCAYSFEYIIGSDFIYDYSVVSSNCNAGDGAIIFSGEYIDNYQFTWSTGFVGDSIGDLWPGGYNVTISEPLGDCFVEETFYISEAADCTSSINGNVWNDSNNPDCQFDNIGGMKNVLIELSNGTTSQATFADEEGFYSFQVDEIAEYTLTVEIMNLPKYAEVCADPIVVNVAEFNQAYEGNDFYLEYTDYEDVVVLLNKGNARPGFHHDINVIIYNLGAVPATGELVFNYSAEQNYISAVPAPSSLNSGMQTMSWNYADLEPAEYLSFNITLITPVGTELGTILEYEAYTNEPAGDVVPENNTANCEIEVTGSFDPNDKQVTPMGIGEEGYIDTTENLLTYHVRFQNTGTDTAFTVLIRDTLDANLDVSTLQPIAGSHAYRTTMPTMNTVEFIFDNIMLPDSFINEPASNGFVTFSIQLKSGLTEGTQIKNSAGIYFDFNDPIITNTVVNTVGIPNAVYQPDLLEIDLILQPNPANEEAMIIFELEEKAHLDFSIVNLRGQVVEGLAKQGEWASGKHFLPLPVNDLLSGVYFVYVEDEMGRVGRIKFVKI